MTGVELRFVPGVHPEYGAFYNGLAGFDKEAFKRQMTASQATSENLIQVAGITLSYPSIGSTPIQGEGFINGAALPNVIGSAASLCEDFKLWLNRHPGMDIEEALHRYREEQKTKQRLQGSKLH